VDYRRLNSITIKNKFPMPLIDEILDELAGAQCFTKLDFKSRFHQVRMSPANEFKTTFKTHHNHYQFRVMPFGLTNALASSQCIMNVILAPFLWKFVIVFMDDILIYSSSLDQHVHHIREVLQVFREHKFFVNLSKCAFTQDELEYLGHIISRAGVANSPRKTQAMVQWPTPTNVTELKGFLGLTGYYQKFVKNYGLLAKPLTNLLKKKQFFWDTVAQVAFDKLKAAMTSTLVLALPDFIQQFIVETDASNVGLGTVLMQNARPITFLSKPLSISNKFLSIYEEFLALIMAVEKWRSYLQGQEFIIRTDHKSLSYLNDHSLQFDLQRKAMAKLMGLQFMIVYRKGKGNLDANALSRRPTVMSMQSCTEVKPLWVQEVINSYATDAKHKSCSLS
jgi:hypothetical protein